MDPKTHDLATLSTCTTCQFKEDFSNYWTAVLYFRAKNGTYKRVPNVPQQGMEGTNGGMVRTVERLFHKMAKQTFRLSII
jgi:hypothetical protein